MAQFNQDELRALMAVDHLPKLTIMMPLTASGSDQRENHTRLKNLLRQAATMIDTFDLAPQDVTAFLAPVQAMLDGTADGDSPFTGGGMGLAFFLTPDPADFRYYTVDFPVEEKVTVSDWFTIKPILPALTTISQFYLLKLSQKQAELLEGTPQTLTPIEIATMPASVEAVVGVNTEGRNAGQQSVGASGSFAGHGAGDEDNDDGYTQQFMHRVNTALQATLNEKTAPLIVVAVEALHPLFSQVNSYKHLIEPGIMGNPVSFTQQALIERALALIAPLDDAAKTDAADRYKAGLHRNQASNIPIDVLQAAFMGQVDTLFVPLDQQLWGVYDLNTNIHELHVEEHPGDVDLFDLAASQTILNHGTVYAVPREAMPEDVPIAAVYRYAVTEA